MQARRSTLSVALTVVVLTLGAGSSTAGAATIHVVRKPPPRQSNPYLGIPLNCN